MFRNIYTFDRKGTYAKTYIFLDNKGRRFWNLQVIENFFYFSKQKKREKWNEGGKEGILDPVSK